MLISFRVEKKVNGEWVYWMHARSVSAERLIHSLWYFNRKKGIKKEDIRVTED